MAALKKDVWPDRSSPFFPSLFSNDGSLPKLIDPTSAAEILGIPFFDLVDLVQKRKIRAYQCKSGLSYFTEADLEAWKGRFSKHLEVKQPHVIVGFDLRKSPRFQFPADAPVKEVLAVCRRILGERMPKVEIAAGTAPDKVFAIVKKALNVALLRADGLPAWTVDLPKYRPTKKLAKVRA